MVVSDEFIDSEELVTLADGHELALQSGDRDILGSADRGRVILFGTEPDRWYLVGSQTDTPDCYRVRVGWAYSEPGSVVLAFESWGGVGIRVPKRPGFDDSTMLMGVNGAGPSGQRQYANSGGGIPFCIDASGRLFR